MPGKSAIGSVTIISALVVVVAQLAQLIGYTISETDQAAMVNLINSGVTVAITIISIIGGLGAIWGRVKASRPIESVLPQPAPTTDAATLNRQELARIRAEQGDVK